MKYIEADGLVTLLRDLARDYDVYAPQQIGDDLVLRRLESTETVPEIAWNDYRLSESFKPFFFQPGRILSEWAGNVPKEGPPVRPRALLGMKACDLKALAVIDCVFRDHTFREPAWCAARENNLIISGDCTANAESCFCSMLGEKPWPESLFDLNLAPVDGGGYLVEIGSEKGEEVVSTHAELFGNPPDGAVASRDDRRSEVAVAVQKQNEPFATKDPFEASVDKNLKTRIWGKLAATCVECNACNLVCPTCHCFLLNDVKTPGGSTRISLWDSCFYAGYARMAGGGTPRLQLTERFKNHYYHKFVSFPRNWGVTACSGCGRCIDACMGRIDKRECLHRLETEWLPSEVLEEIR